MKSCLFADLTEGARGPSERLWRTLIISWEPTGIGLYNRGPSTEKPQPLFLASKVAGSYFRRRFLCLPAPEKVYTGHSVAVSHSISTFRAVFIPDDE